MAHSQSSPSSEQDRQLLAVLEGRQCSFCEDGELERDVYKDNQAVVCDNCGTPRAQIWMSS